MNRREFLAVSTGAAVAVTGCLGDSGRSLPVDPTGDWTHHAHDAQNTGAADVTVPERGNRAWDAGAAHVAAPLVDDGTVFSVAESATALDATTGEQEWEVDLPGAAEQTPALNDSKLLVATDQQIVALEREDGGDLWSIDLPRPARQPVTVAADASLMTVPLAAQQGTPGLVAYDTETGDEVWTNGTLSPRATAIADGTVYATGYKQDGNTGVLRGLDVSDGSQLWEIELDSPDTPPVIADAGVLVGDGGTLAVYDPTDGTRQQSLGQFGERIEAPPAVAGETVFVTASDGTINAVSVANGDRLWRQNTGVVADTGISIGRETVVAAATNLPDASLAGIVAYKRSDGTARWEHAIEGFDAYPSTPPVLADEAVYYVSNESSGVVALGDLSPTDDG